MLKYVLLATAMTVSAPLLAQQAQTAPQTTPAQPANTPVEPSTAAPADTTVAATPHTDSATPATTAQATTAQPATPADPAAPAQTASQPAGGDQVAQVVESEFPTYDRDSSGSLNKTEFASWMDKLKASDPAAPTKTADAKKWNNAAFAQADADKSKSVSKDELTTFLSAGDKAS